MRTFSKYYNFEALQVRLFWYEDGEDALKVIASIQPADNPIQSDKPTGARIAGVLRGTLDKVREQVKEKVLREEEATAAKAALVELAAALGLEKRT